MLAVNALNSSDFAETLEPFQLLKGWLAEAGASEVNDPDAMTLASVDASGLPDARIVLCNGIDERGLVFFTNSESAKGLELAAAPRAAAVFHWKSLRRQVRLRGAITRTSEAEADAYFVTRARVSRIGAWASQQSRPLESRAELEAAVAAYRQKFGEGDIPRPPHWGGYRLTPAQIEFWRDGEYRLHDRVLFSRAGDGQSWRRERLYP
jgi:pyridoxamine 5'-phosphate oxidase